MRRLSLLLILLGLYSVRPAYAQTHPCDQAAVTVVQTNGAIGVGVCFASAAIDGSPVTITSVRITVDGSVVFTGPLTAVGSPNTAGLNYYETPKTITLAKGSHTAVAFASSADGEGPGSDPFVFQLQGLPPGKGLIKKVVK